jgi:D-3-phosphoglycerate dehydrogenase
MTHIVLIPQPVSEVAIHLLKQRGYQVKRGKGCSEEEIAQDVVGCDAILIRNAKITRKILDMEQRLKVVARHGVGVDNIDVEHAARKGIWVTNTPQSNFNAVAEHTIFLLLACAKNAYETDVSYRKGNFDIRSQLKNIELKGKTLGIIGLGRIGQSVAQKARYGFDMNIIGYDPFWINESGTDIIKVLSRIEDVFSQSDFVTLHLPATEQTIDMIGFGLFQIMRKTAFLINTARGEIIKEKDLIQALKDRLIAGAALDVLETEPPAINNPLFQMKQVMLTPHNAAFTVEAFESMALDSVRGIDEVLSGNHPTWPVNRPRRIKDNGE